MTQEEYDDVRQIWALSHAFFDFEQVEDVCENLLTHNSDREQPIYRALLAAIYVTYGRAFKGKPKIKVADDLVPLEHRKLHEQMIEQRDKIYAHTDSNGLPFEDRFNINRVTIIPQFGGRQFWVEKIQTLPATVQKVKELALCMKNISSDERDRLLTKHEAKIPVGGAYYFNVTDVSGPFVVATP